jgi:hypothetical protein
MHLSYLLEIGKHKPADIKETAKEYAAERMYLFVFIWKDLYRPKSANAPSGKFYENIIEPTSWFNSIFFLFLSREKSP